MLVDVTESPSKLMAAGSALQFPVLKTIFCLYVLVIFCGELGRNSKQVAERHPQQKCDDLVNILGLRQRVFLLQLYSWGSKNVVTKRECKPDAA